MSTDSPERYLGDNLGPADEKRDPADESKPKDIVTTWTDSRGMIHEVKTPRREGMWKHCELLVAMARAVDPETPA